VSQQDTDTTESTTAAPRRFELGERYRGSRVSRRGTVVVKAAKPWGSEAMFATVVPCCNIAARVNAALWAGTGAPYTCRSCGWKWDVYLAQGAVRLAQLPRGTKHPRIRADRAEWVSTGHGTRNYRRQP
jgi:hypothetical protein